MAGEIHTAISSPSDKGLGNETLPTFRVRRKSHLSFSYTKLLWGQNLAARRASGEPDLLWQMNLTKVVV